MRQAGKDDHGDQDKDLLVADSTPKRILNVINDNRLQSDSGPGRSGGSGVPEQGKGFCSGGR